jgi:predicted PurR-regulated permease PerM
MAETLLQTLQRQLKESELRLKEAKLQQQIKQTESWTPETQFQTLEDELKTAQLQKQTKEANLWTPAIEQALIKAKGEGGEMTDIFKQQESFNTSIMKVIEGMGGSATPTYVTATQAPQKEEAKSTNYMLYAIVGFVVYFFFLRKKR